MNVGKLLTKIAHNYTAIKPDNSWHKKSKEEVLYFARTNMPDARSYNVLHFWPQAIALSVLIAILPISAIWAQSSMPGDFKYPIKRFWEEVHVAAVIGKQAKQELREQQIALRLKELTSVFEKGDEIQQELALQQTQEIVEDLVSLEEDSSEILKKVLTFLFELGGRLGSEDKQQMMHDLQEFLISNIPDSETDTKGVQDTVSQADSTPKPSPQDLPAGRQGSEQPLAVAPQPDQSAAENPSATTTEESSNDDNSSNESVNDTNDDSDANSAEDSEENNKEETGQNDDEGDDDRHPRRDKRDPRPTRRPQARDQR